MREVRIGNFAFRKGKWKIAASYGTSRKTFQTREGMSQKGKKSIKFNVSHFREAKRKKHWIIIKNNVTITKEEKLLLHL